MLWALPNGRVLAVVMGGRAERVVRKTGRRGERGWGGESTAVPSAQLPGFSGSLPDCMRKEGDPSPLPPLPLKGQKKRHNAIAKTK